MGISMRLEGSSIENVDSMLVIVHQQLLEHLELINNNPIAIKNQYLQHLYQMGKNIDFLYKDLHLVGKITGVDEWGRLQIETASNGTRFFQAGEIRWIWE